MAFNSVKVITFALRKMNVLSAGQVANGDLISEGKDELNALLGDWRLKSINLPIEEISDVDAVLPLDSDYVPVLGYNLAVSWASNYGKQIDRNVQNKAKELFRAVYDIENDSPELEIDEALQRRRRFNFNTGGWS